jgi:hypothetical protein
MSYKSRHTGNLEIIALGTGTSDAAATGLVTIRQNVLIPGDLTVLGNTSTVDTTNVEITDNIIVLNQGEIGPGITLGEAGIQIDRGSEPAVFFVYSEAEGGFVLYSTEDDTIKLTGISTPTGNTDAANKEYVDAAVASVGNASQIIKNDSNVTVADTGANSLVTVVLDNVQTTEFTSSGIELKNSAATIKSTTGLTLDADVLYTFQSSAPSASASGVKVYASNTGDGTKLLYTNSSESGELVSKRRAILYGLIF